MAKAAKTATKMPEGLRIRSGQGGAWTTVEMGDRFSKGLYVFGTKQQMFTLSVTMQCIDVLSQDVSRTPIELRERVDGGDIAVPADKHPVAALLNEPSDYFGPKEFIRILTSHLVTASEHFVAIRRDTSGLGGGIPVEMVGIPRKQGEIRVNPEERRYSYFFSPSTLHDRAQFGWAAGGMTDKDVAHLRKRTMNGLDALATSQLMKSTLDLLDDMREFQSGIFANGGMPIMAFAFPEGLTDDQFERLNKDLIQAASAARKEGRPFILEGAAGEVPKVEKISLSSVDAEFVKAQAAVGLEATRYFRVPPHKVYLLETLKYDNLSAEERRYVDEALCPIFDVVEEGLERVLLTKEDRKRYFLRFDREKAYTSDPEQRQKIVDARWKSGLISKNQALRACGENAIGPAGDVYLFSGNFVMTDLKNEVIMKAGGNAPGADVAGDAAQKMEDAAGRMEKVTRLRVVEN